MKANPLLSEGARLELERRAMRNKLRRELGEYYTPPIIKEILNDILNWVLERQKRYDKKKGGLGK